MTASTWPRAGSTLVALTAMLLGGLLLVAPGQAQAEDVPLPTETPTASPDPSALLPSESPSPIAAPDPTPTPDPTGTPPATATPTPEATPTGEPTPSPTPNAVEVPVADSAAGPVTLRGTGPFTAIHVTVGQTQELTDQAIRVTWSGGNPTVNPANVEPSFDYVQLMQCWGDAETGPTREQCAWGVAEPPTTGTQALSMYYRGLPPHGTDPLETLSEDNCGTGASAQTCVPFSTFAGESVTTLRPSQKLQPETTNEVTFARTYGDGTGQFDFEAQSVLQNYSLGCGSVRSGASRPDPCWLVVVPRSNLEVDGAEPALGQLSSIPLAASNWQYRMVFRLDFEPVGASCPIGAKERLVYGNEVAGTAAISWAAPLCKQGTGNLTFVTLPDDQLRTRISGSSNPSLVFTDAGHEVPDPVDGAEQVWAPVALSGVGFGFLVERQVRSDRFSPASPELLGLAGSAIDSIKLNQRLVLKVITMSYTSSSSGPRSEQPKIPWSLVSDPEFLALNPAFKAPGLNLRNMSNPVLLPFGRADANGLVWDWITADKDARSFLAGKPDPWGMTISPFFKGLDTADRLDFPKLDLRCRPAIGTSIPLCALQQMPYAGSLGAATVAVRRGDNLARVAWDVLNQTWSKGPLPPIGSRSAMGLMSTTGSRRYLLAMASLRNGSGAYVSPTDASMLAAASAMGRGTAPGTRATDVDAGGSAYPLTTLTYAVTVPAHLESADGKVFAALLRLAATSGQQSGGAPGQLPPGYVPLPTALRSQTTAAAATIEDEAGHAVPPTPSPTPLPTATPAPPIPPPPGNGSGGYVPPPVGGDTGGGTDPGSSPTPAPSLTPSTSASPTASPSQSPVAQPIPTPADPLSGSRQAVGIALFLGGGALFLRALLPWVPGRRT